MVYMVCGGRYIFWLHGECSLGAHIFSVGFYNVKSRDGVDLGES